MELNIGGKVYEPISADSYTIAYDLYVQQVLVDAGITDAIAAHAELKETDQEAVGRLVLRRLAESGKVAHLLSAFVQPKDGRWSASWATQTAVAFDALESADERRLLLAILAEGLANFFQPARRSSKTSR